MSAADLGYAVAWIALMLLLVIVARWVVTRMLDRWLRVPPPLPVRLSSPWPPVGHDHYPPAPVEDSDGIARLTEQELDWLRAVRDRVESWPGRPPRGAD